MPDDTIEVTESNIVRVERRLFITLEAPPERKIREELGEQSEAQTQSESETPLAILVANTAYVEPDGFRMLQHYSVEVASDTMGRHFERSSEDNGESWNAPRLLYEPKQENGGIRRRGESCLYFDANASCLISLVNDQLYPEGTFTGDVKRYTRVLYRLSTDGARSFTKEKPLIETGGDETNWARGVTYGENCIQLSFCALTVTNDGKLVLPVCRVPRGSDYEDFFGIAWDAGCFIGSWNGDDYTWELGEMVGLDPEHSTRGADEPTIEQLTDGRLLMVLRASNARRPDISGYKWICTSDDCGRTWSEREPFRYADGKPFFSPAAGSRLIRNSRTRKLYWIGNISPHNPEGNRPRYPLVIAEVDERSCSLKRETVSVIEDKRESDSSLVQLSNFRAYEDRKTGDLIVTLARYQRGGKENPSSPAFSYRIRLLEDQS